MIQLFCLFIFLSNHRQLSVIYLSEIHFSLSDNKENDIDKSSIGEIELSLSEEIQNDLESPISESIETPGSELTTGTDSEITSSTVENPENVENSENVENAEDVENPENADSVVEPENVPETDLSIADKQTEEKPKYDPEIHENEGELSVTEMETDVTTDAVGENASDKNSNQSGEDDLSNNDQINNSDNTESIHIEDPSQTVTETVLPAEEEVSPDQNTPSPTNDDFGDFEADDDFGDFNDNNDGKLYKIVFLV